MDVKKRVWQRGLLFMLLGFFFACPAFVSGAVTPIPTKYPYDQVGVIIGFSGVYDILTIHKFWQPANSNENKYYKYTKASDDLLKWLNNISQNGGNVIRFFSHGNWQPVPKEIPITPWKMDDTTKKFNCEPSSETDWNGFYWTRLNNLMIELKNRKLTAWIDIWDFNSFNYSATIGDETYNDYLYKIHPFYNNSNGFDWPEDKDGLDLFFSATSDVEKNDKVKGWRHKFEERLVNKLKTYNPIYSTNEVLDNKYRSFLEAITDHLIVHGIQKNRISHSPYPAGLFFRNENNTYLVNPSTLFTKAKYGKQLLLATHGNSLSTRIIATDLSDYGIKVISSDAEKMGGIGGFKKNKHPLTAEEAYYSMLNALKIGFWGLELLDRDEYLDGYNEAKVNLSYLDKQAGIGHTKLDTLKHLVNAFSENGVTVTYPNGGEQFTKGEINDIIWDQIPAEYQWGTISIYLYKAGTYIGTIADGIPSNYFYYTWVVGEYEGGTVGPGTTYRIKIRRVSKSGQEMMYDFSDGYFSIIKPPPPVNITN